MTSWGSFLSLGFEEGDKAWKLERHAFPTILILSVHYQESNSIAWRRGGISIVSSSKW